MRVNFRSKLARKITLLYFSVTLVFCILFSVIVYLYIQNEEQDLQSIDMSLAIERIRDSYRHHERISRKDHIFRGMPNSTHFPYWLRDLGPGFHKIAHNNFIWHVIVKDFPDNRYILIRNYTQFENHRDFYATIIILMILTSFILSLILALITMHFVIRPINNLEYDIRRNSNHSNTDNFLQSHYHANEIGRLAYAFDEVYTNLKATLQREKLFTADVSHELRSPLMVILSSCELLLETLEHPTHLKRIKQIEHSSKTILQRLEVYLALARPAQQSSATYTYRTLIEIASAIEQEIQPTAQQFAMQLKIDNQLSQEDANYPYIFCYTILSNLVRNAVEYAGRGSQITLRLEDHCFSVIDNGQGIAEEHQTTIFDSFVSGAHSDQHFGIGLSLVKRICDYLNWQIELKSHPNLGTCFSIYTKPNH